MKRTLQDSQDFKLAPEERATLKNFANSKEWKTQKEVMERYILLLTSNLLLGTETYQGSSNDELKELRGFVRYWNKLKNLIETQDE